MAMTPSLSPPSVARPLAAFRIFVLALALLAGLGCSRKNTYVEMPLDYRHKNVKGIEALFLDHLNRHPEDWKKFVRILSEADEALNQRRYITRRHVVKWIDQQLKKEAFDVDRIPGFFFLRSVYLEGWDNEFFDFVDENEREMLNDLITGVMGALHNCRTCRAAHGPPGHH